MPRPLKFVAVLGLVVFVLSTWAIVRLAKARSASGGPSAAVAATTASPALGLSIPEFSLINPRGEPFSRNDLKGRITVLNFVFTHCPLICPTLMEKMQGLSIALKDEPVHFLSISVDPEHDTPEALTEFAKLHNADKDNWTLLTGDKAAIDRIITDGLKFALTPDPSTPIQLADGTTMTNIIHPGWFLLIGPDAEVLSLYRPTDPVHLEVLGQDVRRLAKELPRKKQDAPTP